MFMLKHSLLLLIYNILYYILISNLLTLNLTTLSKRIHKPKPLRHIDFFKKILYNKYIRKEVIFMFAVQYFNREMKYWVTISVHNDKDSAIAKMEIYKPLIQKMMQVKEIKK